MHGCSPGDALGILHSFGGLEQAAMAGLYLGAAASGIAIICDGFIASASAALAVRLSPATAGYLFAGHLSTEPGHSALLSLMQQEPLLDLNMRLGEGTGAALAMNIFDAAVRAFVEMATFESAGVSDKQELAQEVDR
jgi:nicotinate-nucleotide--dimethylbenzimidazole phosphoribosyltransferase